MGVGGIRLQSFHFYHHVYNIGVIIVPFREWFLHGAIVSSGASLCHAEGYWYVCTFGKYKRVAFSIKYLRGLIKSSLNLSQLAFIYQLTSLSTTKNGYSTQSKPMKADIAETSPSPMHIGELIRVSDITGNQSDILDLFFSLPWKFVWENSTPLGKSEHFRVSVQIDI